MEDEDVTTNTQMDTKKGRERGGNGTPIDRQPDTVICQAGLNQSAGRGSRSGPGAHGATGIRVLKASRVIVMHMEVETEQRSL